MKNINWTVRLKNKTFWLTFIPAVLILISTVGSVFGLTINLTELGDKLLDVVEAVFVVLAVIGVVTDPTTAGVGDSRQAMTYINPKK